MKKQTKSNLPNSLHSLGIIFLILFSMAFACKEDEDGVGVKETNSNGQINDSRTKANGGRCSTEADFRYAISQARVKRYKDESKVKRPEVIFRTFKVNSSVTKRLVVNNSYVDVTAYPVKADYLLRYFQPKYPSGLYQNEFDVKNVSFYCYKNPEDDYENTETGCVCKAQGIESREQVQRRCEYVEGEPNRDCPEQ